MASFAQLPDELRRLLETATATFASTATKFLEAIPSPEQHFARACEILITLTATTTSAASTGVSHGSGDWRPMEKGIGFQLNATFMLYWLYREYDIHLNPFRSHFVETCEAERARPTSSEKWSGIDRLRKARCKMLLAILGGEGSKLADLSAKDFYTNFEQLRLGESTDLRTFAEEEEAPIQAWATTATTRADQPQSQSTNGYHGNSGGRHQKSAAAARGTPSPSPGQAKQPVFAQNYPMPVPFLQKDQEANTSAASASSEKTVSRAFVDALSNAHVRHLASSEKNMLLSNITHAARIYPTTADPEPYRRMLDLNFDILQPLTVEILLTTSERNPHRNVLLNAILPKLNLELRSLDLINHIVLRPARDDAPPPTPPPSRTPKSSGSSASSTAASDSKPPLLTAAERTHLLHVFISNCILKLETPYGDLDGIPATARRAKGPDVARKVKLLCMFITNLLTREVVTASELYFELQNIYMGFTAVKEAKELWANATGGRGVGMGFISIAD
ncbi:hypothetical protein Dda_5775 [Drechslerella dactyloides]|uniref:CCR4-NOT transcription complex subunit 11 n=1 Tax=Drechslerella dactyloides TaxID=74499 RepID=A0AAD6NHV7_DREDA|nr:hypothetical protein Dda_5775 [Drechslerella dactyloides]